MNQPTPGELEAREGKNLEDKRAADELNVLLDQLEEPLRKLRRRYINDMINADVDDDRGRLANSIAIMVLDSLGHELKSVLRRGALAEKELDLLTRLRGHSDAA